MMQLNRRTVLAGMGSTLLAAGPGRLLATTRLSMDGMDVLSVSDGNLMLPGSFFFDGLPADEVTAILKRYDIPTDMLEPPCNVTVLRQDDRTVLFDAGAGHAFMPTAGTLLDSLSALDITPDEVTNVVLTHGHPDHLWGVLDDFDDLVFQNADYMIGQAEWDFWSDPATVTSVGEARASFAVGAARRLEAIADRCSFFSPDQEILPGVMAHGTFGHTPGHMSFELRAGSDAVMVVGDAIGNHHVAFERPGWGSGSDQDRDMGAATRTRLLDQLAQDQMMMIGFHLPGGGIGRVERTADAYRFVPEDA